MQEEEKDEQETREDVTIPQMVEDVRVGRMPRRRLITVLSALGISAVGVGAVVAATEFQQNSKAVPRVNQNDNTQHHIQLHNNHITHQSRGNKKALHDDYAEHAIVEDSMYPKPLVWSQSDYGAQRHGHGCYSRHKYYNHEPGGTWEPGQR